MRRKMTLNEKTTQIIAKPIIKSDAWVRKVFRLKPAKSDYFINKKGIVLRKLKRRKK